MKSLQPEGRVHNGLPASACFYLPLVAGLVVDPEEVFPKVPVEITPHGMDVIGTILCVVELNEEGGGLYAVIMRVPLIDAARPGEVDVPTGFFDLPFALFRQLRWHIAGVLLQ
jgi:hypothetical protein